MPEFHETPMGHKFFEHTMPELVHALEDNTKAMLKAADVSERYARALEVQAKEFEDLLNKSGKTPAAKPEAIVPPSPKASVLDLLNDLGVTPTRESVQAELDRADKTATVRQIGAANIIKQRVNAPRDVTHGVPTEEPSDVASQEALQRRLDSQPKPPRDMRVPE